jgi:hypothetical protein
MKGVCVQTRWLGTSSSTKGGLLTQLLRFLTLLLLLLLLLLQIRAANLSGDCSFYQEFVRGNLSEAMVGQHKRCVRRRALLSVSLNPHCQGGKAEQAVGDMMKHCFRDTDPFPRIPGL